MEYRKQQFQTYEEFSRQFPCDYSMPFARGGHGELYRGIDTETNDEVAIKRRLYTVSDDALSLEKEYTNTQEVPPNRFIVRYLYYGRYATPFGTYEYLVMRYYRDGNLTNNVLPWHQLSDTLQRRFVEEFLLGLNHLHNHKIVHRDIKPENVLLVRYAEQQSSAYRPVLADFGISKVLAENPEIARTLVQNSMRVGTVTYMAPEQLRGDRVTYNSDLWSFGIILYEIITRKHMIARRSFSEQQREEAYGFWRNVDEERFPDDLSTIAQPYQELIRRCLVVNPKLRVWRATDLIDLMSKPVPAPTPVVADWDAADRRSADVIRPDRFNPDRGVAVPDQRSAEAVSPARAEPVVDEGIRNDVDLVNGQHLVVADEPEVNQPIPEAIEVIPLSQLTMQLTEQWEEPVLKKEEPKLPVGKKTTPIPATVAKVEPPVESAKVEVLNAVVPPLPEPVNPVLPPVFEIAPPTRIDSAGEIEAVHAAQSGVESVPVELRPVESKSIDPVPVLVKDASDEPEPARIQSDDAKPDEFNKDEAAKLESVDLIPIDVYPTKSGSIKSGPTSRGPAKRRAVKRRQSVRALKNRGASVVNQTLTAVRARWQTARPPAGVVRWSPTLPRHRWPTRLLLTALVLVSLTVGVYSSGPGVDEIAPTGPTLQQSESYIVALQRFNRYREYYQKTGALNEYLWTFIHCNPTYEDSLVDSGVRRADEMLKINETVFPTYQGNPSGLKRQEMKRLVLNKISWESRPHETDELSCQPRN